MAGESIRKKLFGATDRFGASKHSGKVRAFLVFNVVLSLLTVTAGVALLYTNWKLGNRQVVTIDSIDYADLNVNLPEGDLTAKNYLITGSDNDACIDPDSPFYGGFGNRDRFGERSDTIMVIRANPKDQTAAILSFPRDMWVKLAGSNGHGRINATTDKKNPNRLIRTIRENFGIVVDHYVNIDFCAFKEIVDALGGVRVPFKFKAQDKRTGFKVLRANTCFTFQGDHALAYVRSRHYRYFDPAKAAWVGDNGADWGRISRQQDFTKRIVKKALDRSRTNPRVASGILNAALKNVITDDRVTPLMLLQLGQAMKNFDANTMGSYIMPGLGQVIDEMSVIVPDMESDRAQKILAVFRGRASLATTKPASSPTTTAVSATTIAPTTTTTAPGRTTTTVRSPSVVTTTLPAVSIEERPRGLVPPNDLNCQY